jgi:hypothetical protein
MLLSAGPSESGSAWRDLETLTSLARPLRSDPNVGRACFRRAESAKAGPDR